MIEIENDNQSFILIEEIETLYFIVEKSKHSSTYVIFVVSDFQVNVNGSLATSMIDIVPWYFKSNKTLLC